MLDKNIPLKDKWWIMLLIIYILSPIDLIPAPIIGFSVIDDLVVLSFLYTVVWEKVNKYYGNSKDVEKNKDKIVEDVEYEIHEDEEE
jgi:uncharacterized membrane protein YkvA (DUF1232 family)